MLDASNTRRRQTCYFRKRATSVPAEGPAYGLDSARRCEFPLRASTFCKGGVQWKQGVVNYMMLYTILLCNITPIHCTPLPLHPPLQSIQSSAGAGVACSRKSHVWCRLNGLELTRLTNYIILYHIISYCLVLFCILYIYIYIITLYHFILYYYIMFAEVARVVPPDNTNRSRDNGNYECADNMYKP